MLGRSGRELSFFSSHFGLFSTGLLAAFVNSLAPKSGPQSSRYVSHILPTKESGRGFVPGPPGFPVPSSRTA